MTSSLANGKLKQLQGQEDEANLKLLRELSHIPAALTVVNVGLIMLTSQLDRLCA